MTELITLIGIVVALLVVGLVSRAISKNIAG